MLAFHSFDTLIKHLFIMHCTGWGKIIVSKTEKVSALWNFYSSAKRYMINKYIGSLKMEICSMREMKKAL